MREPPLDPLLVLGLKRTQMPRHVAIIMDGNGRWASERGLPRIRGHEQGAKAVRAIVTQCARLGIEALTLYSFSTENWKRPKEEVDFLMDLYARYLVAERDEILGNNIQFKQLGRRQGLPQQVLDELDTTTSLSQKNTGLKLCLALNYSSRSEIVEGVQKIVSDVLCGKIEPAQINEEIISQSLYSVGLPDPDLLIRTAGEMRISNFMLWQISYAEYFSEPVCWPDFTVDHLHRAILEFATRERRYGGLAQS